MIGRWIREFEEQASGRGSGVAERDELKQLRRENRELRMEKEILEKASTYFATEMK
jgi:transposase